jgi:hypothetical protein
MQVMAEYSIKMYGDWPGLGRETILGQFEREYGWDMAALVASFEKNNRSTHRVETFVEMMGKGMVTMMPSRFRS